MSRLRDWARRRVRGGVARSAGAQRVALGVATAVLVTVPHVLQTVPFGLTVDEPSPRTFRASETVEFVDEAATERARTRAAEAVEPVTVFDAEAVATGREEVAHAFVSIRAARPLWSVEPTRALAAAAGTLPSYDQEWIAALLSADDTEFARAERSAEQLAATVLGLRLTAEEREEALRQLHEGARGLPVSGPLREAVAGIIEPSVRPTLSVNEVATEAARKAAADQAAPVVVVKRVGENIVQRGEIVTPQHLEIIRRLGLLGGDRPAVSLLALGALAGIVLAAATGYLWRFERPVFESSRQLALLALLLVASLWTTRAALWFFPEMSPYLLPVPLTAMLATVLVNMRVGLLAVLVTTADSLQLGLTEGSGTAAMLVWGVLAVLAMSFMTERARLVYVGLFLVGSGASLAWLASLAQGRSLTEATFSAAGAGIGGVLAAVLGYGLLPFFEHAFKVTTDVRLIELGSPAHPLMRRLMVEAPGTYGHSVITGNLAEAAAEAIGANPLLARVGAYYHDVGKISRPAFFVENQAGTANPHDETTPELSAIIITAHVREGLELARQYRLPQEVVDIVEQHHGDSLVSYFYNKATLEDDAVSEADFRYAFARPQSREAALVMLADSAEAAVRAMKRPSRPRIESTVRRVIDGKVTDGQLRDSELTLADLERINQVYARMLQGIYHPRVEYPQTVPRRPDYADQHH
ncbi:MAG TPA: HDIG domain-containing protein [Coriobacteriia bacterium]|nr:HDIG domain-containing protein [Coriobacteriia bacterium]